MPQESTPSGSELVGRAAELRELIRSKVAWSQDNRRLHGDVVAAMSDAGVFAMRTPARYGGHESDARTVMDVLATLAEADGSTAWNAAVWSVGNWIASLFPDGVQDQVFERRGARVCAVLSPTASATPNEGGLVVNGRWPFTSGAGHSHWQCVMAMAPAPDGTPWPVMALVPMDQLGVVDDWHSAGLSATGSVTTVATDLFVPEERVLPLPEVLAGRYASRRNADSPVFSAPLVPTGCATFSGVAVGLATAARDTFLERLPDRKITYTDYAGQSDAPVTHLQVAEATVLLEETRFHARRVAGLVDRKGATGEVWKLEDRVLARVTLGRTFDLAKRSVAVLAEASGGSSLHRSVLIGRVHRDVQALNLHALMHPSTNYELYGRVLCGLEPNTSYL
ncbi:acyl-CoA dehydrogenase family protein [Geodermatophilus maliterrae]|uniref:Acyl-CoA dehydrogenase family protein n=1 Tax=Geodermatophilus maliterrae TaxID=3162531 RepID=A0ABV3XHK0_9ACTN